MRLIAIAFVSVLGCGDDGGSRPRDAAADVAVDVPRDVPADLAVDAPMLDAPTGTNTGFTAPTAVIGAWTETAPNTFVAATLDLSCLGDVRNDVATTTAVTLSATVSDYQSGNASPGATVEMFAGTAIATPITTATANGSAVATLTVPTGTTRHGFHLTAANSRPTYYFDQILAPSTAAQQVSLDVISDATAATLPALIGMSTDAASAIEIGTATDCQGHTLSGLIATVSSIGLGAIHLPGAVTYYYSDANGLPVRHNIAAMTTKNGTFMVIEVPATTLAYVQLYGFRTAGELSAGTLTMIARLSLPITTGSALITRHDPRAAP